MQIKQRAGTLAAVIAFSGVAAFAQMRADVPFPFTTPGGGKVAAGSIEVRDTRGVGPVRVYAVRNIATKSTVLVTAQTSVRRARDMSREDGTLVFRCVHQSCALAGVFAPGEIFGSAVAQKTENPPPATEVAEIRIPLTTD